jgi:hypothetical protein
MKTWHIKLIIGVYFLYSLLKNSHYSLNQPVYRKSLTLDCAKDSTAKKTIEDVKEGRKGSELRSRRCAKRQWAGSNTKLCPPKSDNLRNIKPPGDYIWFAPHVLLTWFDEQRYSIRYSMKVVYLIFCVTHSLYVCLRISIARLVWFVTVFTGTIHWIPSDESSSIFTASFLWVHFNIILILCMFPSSLVLHLIVVRRFEYASDPASYTSGSVATGRASPAGRVNG